MNQRGDNKTGLIISGFKDEKNLVKLGPFPIIPILPVVAEAESVVYIVYFKMDWTLHTANILIKRAFKGIKVPKVNKRMECKEKMV